MIHVKSEIQLELPSSRSKIGNGKQRVIYMIREAQEEKSSYSKKLPGHMGLTERLL